MSLNVGKLQATLEIEDSAFTSALNKARAAMQELANAAQGMGSATKQAGSDAATGANQAADGARKQAQESKKAGDEARRSGEAGRQAGQATEQGATRAATSIKSTGTAAQQLRERFTQASQSGRDMGDQVTSGGTRAASSIKSTGTAAQALRERFTQASQSGRQMGEQVASGGTRAASSIKSTGTAAQHLRAQFQQNSRAGRDMGDQIASSSTRAATSIKSTGAAADRLRAQFQQNSQAGRDIRVSDQPASELRNAGGAAGEFGISLGRVRELAAGLGIVFGAHQIVSFFTDAVGAAREAEAIMFRTTNTFGDAAGAVNKWAEDSARSFGLSEDAAKSAALNFSSFGLAMGQSGQELATYSTGLSELAGDLAAYGDYDMETVVQDMSSALSGGTETMRKYGVLLDQNTLRQIAFEEGITESNRMLTQEERVLAASAAMHDKLSYAVGASANSQGTFGASVRNLKAGFQDASAEIGGKFIPILTAVTGVLAGPGMAALSGFGTAIGALLSPIAGLMNLFSGLPGPIQATVGAMVAMRVGAMLLATSMGQTLVTALGVAGLSVGAFGKAMGAQVVAMRASVAANGLGAASMGALGTAAGGLKKGLGGVVNMLGGPWMIALAATVGVVASFVSSAKSASEANQKMSDAAAAGTAAQNDLADALARSNGEMSDQAVAAAQSIVQSSLDATNAKAEQSHNIFSQMAVVMGRVGSSYNDFASVAENATSSMDRNAAATEMAKLENQALGDASAEAGTKVEDAAQIAANGGPQWDSLKAALMRTGEAGEAVIADLEGARAEIDMVRESVARAEPGSYQLAEAFRSMADEASSADDKATALKSALDALTGGQMSARDAAQAHNDEIRRVAESTMEAWDAADGWGEALVQNGNQIDTTTANGSKLRDSITGLIDTTVQAAASGADMDAVWAQNEESMVGLANATGLPIEKIRELAEAEGLLPETIDIAAAVNGTNEVVADLARVATELEGVPPGKTIEVEAPSDAAITELRAAGWEVESIPGTKNVNVTATTDSARTGLLETSLAAGRLDALAPDVQVDTNAEWVTHALNVTAETTEGLPPGHIEITDTTDENLARLGALGIEVSRDKHGRVIINDQDVNRARDNVRTLDNENTSSTHTVYIGTVNRGGNDQSSGGTTVGQHYGANGGFLPTQSFADGGLRTDTLPDAAVIAQPQGTRGLVQWAEAETEGEAFIPLAKSKRARSLEIWKETGRRLGALGKFANGGILPDGDGQKGDIGGLLAGKFADGGIMAGGLIDFAKGVEGKPYVWGGVNWGDCSGAVSALANYVSGRSHFGSRFATGNEREALADRGFVSGRGGPGDLQIGWFNGGPYGGHTAATLPDGTNFEMGGGRGNGQFGGPAAGADDGQFTDHAYFPMSRFADIDAALGGSAYESIAAQLGQGNPEMAHVPDNRTPRQKNIDAIVAEGERRKMSDRDIQVALMTAEQESGIRVLNNPADAPSMSMDAEGTGYDGTSTGIFQQQNNGAWGTLEDRMDPTKSAGMFYDALSKVEGRDQMSLTKAAQTVQGSAHPDAYAKHEGMASEELAASKKRLETLASQSSGGGKGGKGQAVYVTNWPSGGGSYGGGSSAAISEAASAVGDAEDAAFIQENSIASFLADQAGRRDLVQKSDGGVSVTAFADGGFHGIENHSAHIAPAGSWRIFGEPETGGEAYIPLASNKRARSLDIWMETGKRLGMTGLGIAGVAGSLLTGGGLSTGWNGPSMSDLGIDTGALGESLKPGVAAQAEAAGQQVAEILSQLGAHIETSVDGTLQQANAQSHRAKQQYARAMI